MLLLGDSKDKLKELADDSVDLLCTDSPYLQSKGGFMGKEWDKQLPDIAIWKECLRVIKPGAFGFVMCTPKQSSLARMIIMLEDAGFRIDFTSLYHTYSSGFPKAHNISKTIDKKFNKLNTQDYAVLTKEKPPVNVFDASGRYVVDYKKGVAVPPEEKANGTGGISRGAAGVKQVPAWIPVYGREVVDKTIATTPEAKQFDGAYGGFQVKPAVEVIIVVQKPMTKKTYVEQALDNGKGCVWLDDCRIPYADDKDIPSAGERTCNFGEQEQTPGGNGSGKWANTPQGRFPGNLIIEDNVLDNGITKKGDGSITLRQAGTGAGILAQYDGRTKMPEIKEGLETVRCINDTGSYSRFFSLDAWTERNLPFLITPKPSKKERNLGMDDMKNDHPTLKSIRLMSFLITMGSRPGDIVLDPFLGSGTTGCAAALLGREFIGVELDEHYMEIAKKRIDYWSSAPGRSNYKPATKNPRRGKKDTTENTTDINKLFEGEE